ncbi:HRDC domain-containing protein [Cohnella sp. OV330]|uniref:HRDC domain-containing protein n=1 Tax=Cohnella sp. OV330 TaxID=1855288 RepID=UPI0008E48B9C|nr:HRDC domain-containing protein [Cohnella sp. OV330]SFA89170.1 HRDC domain-containing protein [Cohnella sp. OV330]
MKIVFLNRLEQDSGYPAGREGQVFIGEEQGNWTAGWQETAEGGDAERTIWYEGTSWEELLSSFRHGVAGRMKEGYRPMLDGMLEDTPFWERKPQLQTLLQCYADGQPASDEVVESLRVWRRTKAAEEKRPAYMIATNRELHGLAVFLPHSQAELQQVPGFGKLKAERYGAELVAMLAKTERSHAFPLDWVSAAVTSERYAAWMFAQREDRYGKSLSLIQEKRKLLAGIREGSSLAELAERMQCARRELIARIEQLDEEGYDVLPLIDQELAAVPEQEKEVALGAMDELGDRFLKPLQQRVYGGAAGTEYAETERQYEKLRMLRISFRRSRKIAI